MLKFQEGNAAWQELQRTDPDLLITDLHHPRLNGWEMLQLLAERKVTYPVLVTSGLAKAIDVRKCAGPKLNITFLQKPYTLEQFNRVLLTQVGPKTNSNV